MPANIKYRIVFIVFALAIVGVVASFRVYRNNVENKRIFNDVSIYPVIFKAKSQLSIPQYNEESIKESENLISDREVITSKAYLVGDVSSGDIFLQNNIESVLPVASVSKLITAIVAKYEINTTDLIRVGSSSLDMPPEYGKLSENEFLSKDVLLNIMLVSSSNIAAESFASFNGRISFIEKMSSYAWEIGMSKSYFADPSGLNERNMSSAKELFELVKYIYSNEKWIFDISKKARYSISTTTRNNFHDITSTHPFVNDPRFLGGKTGRTYKAGETMITILNMNGRPIVFIVLGSEWGKRGADTRMLLEKYLEMI